MEKKLAYVREPKTVGGDVHVTCVFTDGMTRDVVVPGSDVLAQEMAHRICRVLQDEMLDDHPLALESLQCVESVLHLN